MARLQVGLPELVGDVAKYASRFDMVELHPEPGAAPRAATLRGWRRAVNPSFTFSVVLPRIVGELSMSKEMDAALDEAERTAPEVDVPTWPAPSTPEADDAPSQDCPSVLPVPAQVVRFKEVDASGQQLRLF